jgi:hypothetical protein
MQLAPSASLADSMMTGFLFPFPVNFHPDGDSAGYG